ncbi:hypothetical protein TWF225_002895 [Orbilia oligospora]|nr:hypothetical protein TWF225_002895 [Orbilia oligospora]KAF3250005.1 hypothetical protein TWF128_007595 [Orbilia oligospora]KAF3263164.1 hypothetical protein TWF217_003610 [Orbilia oligospora]KAF3289013.1 hypothetical protein TWF132_007683 [Orbilia oligospora]
MGRDQCEGHVKLQGRKIFLKLEIQGVILEAKKNKKNEYRKERERERGSAWGWLEFEVVCLVEIGRGVARQGEFGSRPPSNAQAKKKQVRTKRSPARGTSWS